MFGFLKKKISCEKICDDFVMVCLEDADLLSNQYFSEFSKLCSQYNVTIDKKLWFFTICTFITLVTLNSRSIINMYNEEESKKILTQLEKSIYKKSFLAWEKKDVAESILELY